jgi:hypothetical protein
MSASGFTPISIYYSTTASAVPTAANLVPGELAINTNDGKLYYEDSSGVVQVLATKSTGSIGGSNTQVQFNNSGSLGGSSGLTWDGSFLTTSSIKNSALTSGRVTFAGASGLLSDSSKLTFDTSNLTVGVTGLSANADGATGKLVLRKPNEASGNGQITRMLDFAPYYPGFDEAVVKASIFSGVDTGTQNGQLGFMTATGGVLSEKMRILADGKVGIGTSSPSGKLQIDSTNVDPSATAIGITLINSTSSQATNNGGSISLGGVYTGSSITQFGYILGAKANSTDGNYAGYLSFGTRPNGDVSQERMRIDSSGNLLVGTTSNSAGSKMAVSSSGVTIYDTGYRQIYMNGQVLSFFNGSNEATLTQSGVWTNASDSRLKKNITNIKYGLNTVLITQPRSFERNDVEGNYIGFIAQELKEHIPEVVYGEKQLSVDYGSLVAVAFKAIQEQQALIESLTTRLTALESK